ncbi:unnamed protein product [Orchesella dallaii]|uniref:Uncharacterized protein n=1 Tax=Orchesella dallaii TaxID=48710 RepID=A0ABP1R528_9HEXA
MGRPCNPCMCTSLETGVKILAVLEIVGCFIYLIVISIFLYAIDYPEAVDSDTAKVAKELGTGELIVLIMIGILTIGISIGLYYWGAIKKKTEICWIFIGYIAIYLIFNVIFLILGLASSEIKERVHILSIINYALSIIIESYIIWVVHSFIMELRQEQEQSQLLATAPGAFGGETGGMLEGSIYRAVDEGNYYSAEQPQPDNPTLVDQSQPTTGAPTSTFHAPFSTKTQSLAKTP